MLEAKWRRNYNELERYTTVIGAKVFVEDGGIIKKGAILSEWDPYSVPILSEQTGVVHFHDFVNNVSVKKEIDEATGLKETVVLESKEHLHPQIVIQNEKTNEIFL